MEGPYTLGLLGGRLRPTQMRSVNPDGSVRYAVRASKGKTELSRIEAEAIINKYFDKLENEIIEVINQLTTKSKMNTRTQKTAPTEKEALINRLDAMNKKINVALAKSRGPIKAGAFFTADGQLLDFGEKVIEFTDVQIGSAATVDGKPAEGEYTMPDGKKLTFQRGKVTEMKGMQKNRVPFKNKKRPPSGTKRPFHKPENNRK